MGITPGTGVLVPPTSAPDSRVLLQQKTLLQAHVKRAANWFYWIAGLSVINTVIMSSGGNARFVVGLGATQFLDAVAAHAGGAGATIAFILDALIAGLFVFFGVFAGKASKPAFIAGIVLYALDAAILIPFQDWFALAFHAFALWCISRGFGPIGELQNIESQLMRASSAPIHPGA